MTRLPNTPRWWQRCNCCRRKAQWRCTVTETAWCMPCKFGGDPDDPRCICTPAYPDEPACAIHGYFAGAPATDREENR